VANDEAFNRLRGHQQLHKNSECRSTRATEDLRAALTWIRKTHKGEDLVQPIVDLLTERMGDQPEPAA